MDIEPCEATDPALHTLVAAMTAELVAVYGLPPDARPSPLPPGTHYLMGTGGGVALGCCAVQPEVEGWCLLNRMYVAPPARGSGLAAALLAAAEDVARRAGATGIRLETGLRQPAAMRLYERKGYRRVAAFPPHENDPESVCYQSGQK
ncbi:GNAT family N-acetyltransferase [Amycolatopsis sp. NPDC051372]|uniref:GNAT family N-acetyltransferase n=1 Tax=Amycolatopsis sp. NPDC051372 TaxID=3155669 RepID=UPI00342FB1CB